MYPGTGGEEQAVHLHQDPGGAGARVLQGQQGEEPGGRARPAAGAAHAGVPQRHLDLARPAAGHQERHQEVCYWFLVIEAFRLFRDIAY